MKNVRSYYDILGVDRSATTEEIKSRYRELAKRFHPDHAQDKDLAHQVFPEITRAYRALSDPSERAAYDAASRNTVAVTPPPAFGPGIYRNTAASDVDDLPLDLEEDDRAAELLAEADLALLSNQPGRA